MARYWSNEYSNSEDARRQREACKARSHRRGEWHKGPDDWNFFNCLAGCGFRRFLTWHKTEDQEGLEALIAHLLKTYEAVFPEHEVTVERTPLKSGSTHIVIDYQPRFED